MDTSFFVNNRMRLLERLPDNCAAVLFSGDPLWKSADAYYPFAANRNYLYLAGADYEGYVLLLSKYGGRCGQTLYILPKDTMKERWNGYRYSPEEVRAISGIEDIGHIEDFEDNIHKLISSGKVSALWLDLFRNNPADPDTAAHRFCKKVKESYPWLVTENLEHHMRSLRTIKAPCEIEALKKAQSVTKEGIIAMMKASRPGIREHDLKAEFDYALLKNGVITPAFPPIISSGKNNFFIHYSGYGGLVSASDMILVDVGSGWDNIANDVSRAWPCNGKFSKEQAALYNAAYHTSSHMFGTIRPGMPMNMVDETVRKVCAGELKKLGLISGIEEAGKLIWHGGSHHVGWDVHDLVDKDADKLGSGELAPGMVFCVDVGIYCEQWGIGFRLEDNCLITETGCVNLSSDIPRSIEEIEAVMRQA